MLTFFESMSKYIWILKHFMYKCSRFSWVLWYEMHFVYKMGWIFSFVFSFCLPQDASAFSSRRNSHHQSSCSALGYGGASEPLSTMSPTNTDDLLVGLFYFLLYLVFTCPYHSCGFWLHLREFFGYGIHVVLAMAFCGFESLLQVVLSMPFHVVLNHIFKCFCPCSSRGFWITIGYLAMQFKWF